MTLLINSNASETKTRAGRISTQTLVQSLLKSKIQGFSKGILIPDDLISEIEDFAKRNSLSKLAFIEEEYANECCPRCLKAHAIKKAKELGLNQVAIIFLDSILEGEAGHNGYYSDGEDLVKID